MPTVRTFPFDAVSGQPSYGAVAMRDVFQAMVVNGVVRNLDDELAVVASTPNAMTVEIKSGAAWINGALYRIAAGGGNVVLSVPANTSGSTRQDYVVLRWDLTTSPNDIIAVYKTGTTSPPSLVRTSTQYEVALAQVSVPNGATAIAQSNITDTRFDPALCGVTYARSFPPVTNLEWPVPLASGTEKLLYSGATQITYTPPNGFVAYVVALYNGNSVAINIGNNSIPTYTYYSNLTFNPSSVQLHRPFLVDSSIGVFLTTNVGLTVYEVPNTTAVIPVVANVSSSTGYTVPSGQTLVILRVHTTESNLWWLYDNAVGSARPLLVPQPSVYGSGSSLLGNSFQQGRFQGSAGNFQVPMDPQPARPVLVPAGRQIRATTTNTVTIMGYLVPWAWTVATS